MFQVTKRLSIIIKLGGSDKVFLTKYIKNNNPMNHRLAESPYLKISETMNRFGGIPAKASFDIEKNIINKYFSNSNQISNYLKSTGSYIYYTRAIRNFRPFFDFIPCHKNADGTNKIPTEMKSVIIDPKFKNTLLGILNSTITFLIFSWFTDVRNINPGLINQLFIAKESKEVDFSPLTIKLMKDYFKNKVDRYNQSNGCLEAYYYPVKSKEIIDLIDNLLAKYYGFTDEELDFIINYDIKYRMGDELNS